MFRRKEFWVREKNIYGNFFFSYEFELQGEHRFTTTAFGRFIDVSAQPISKQDIFHARKKASQDDRARTSDLLFKWHLLTWFPPAPINELL